MRRLGCGLVLIGALFAFQRPFKVYPSMEPYDDVPLPPDYQDKAEWVFGRLMYPQHPNARFGRCSRRYGGVFDWREWGPVGHKTIRAGIGISRRLCGV